MSGTLQILHLQFYQLTRIAARVGTKGYLSRFAPIWDHERGWSRSHTKEDRCDGRHHLPRRAYRRRDGYLIGTGFEVSDMVSVVAPVKSSGLDWKAIIAGAIAAAAISGLLTAFGAAIGLSLTSAHRTSGLSITTLAIAAALWMVMVHIWSFAAGGYLAGRLSEVTDLDLQETQFRAGAHGFMVWALGTAVGLLFLALAAGTAARTTAEVAGRAASGVAQAASTVSAETLSYAADALFRVAPGNVSAPPAQKDPAIVAEAGRILGVALAEGSISNSDKAYLAQIVSRQTGLPEADAQRRVDEAYGRARSMKEAAETRVREAADKARRQAVVAGFLAAAASLLGLVAATWAAGLGREHQNAKLYPTLFGAERFW
jgi:hypothetical protein